MQINKLTMSLALVMLGFGQLKAQEAVPAAGGNGSGTGGSMSYSVGQVVYTYQTGANGSSSQGVQHTYDIFNGLEEQTTEITLSAYPNPVTDVLTLSVENADISGMHYEVYNNLGQLLTSDVIVNSQTLVSMKEMGTATYFLRVKKNGEAIQSFTIIKK